MLLGLLLHWIIDTNSRHYPSMRSGQRIAFISDIGAQELKPMFIAMCAVCTVLFDLSFAAELWLRKRGRLAPNKSTAEKVLMAMTIIFAIVGTAGLILLAVFDTWRHNTLHNIFLLLFIGGYWISAIFICAEYQRLGISMSSPPYLTFHRNPSITQLSQNTANTASSASPSGSNSPSSSPSYSSSSPSHPPPGPATATPPPFWNGSSPLSSLSMSSHMSLTCGLLSGQRIGDRGS
jgi:hypothetical protein